MPRSFATPQRALRTFTKMSSRRFPRSKLPYDALNLSMLAFDTAGVFRDVQLFSIYYYILSKLLHIIYYYTYTKK